ncbi:MAG: hypothetical protein IT245_06755 [Bacteroidia bacterium]|nr:hypothetical protein [Bacteroidia bacterium]
MAIGIGSTWNEDYEAELRDREYLLGLSEKARKKILKNRKIAEEKSNAFFKKARKENKAYSVGTWTEMGPLNKNQN